MEDQLSDASLLSADDKWALIPAFFRVKSFVRHHVESFDYFISTDMQKIVASDNVIRCDADPRWFFRFLNVYVDKPCLENNGVVVPTTPHECRLRDLTYAAPIMADVEYYRDGMVITRRRVKLGMLPIMLRSSRCVLHSASNREMAQMRECPMDPGGYFVVRGTERVILMQEGLSKNRIILERDAKGDCMAAVTSTSAERKSRTNVVHRRGRFYLRHNSFTEDIPLATVFKAMGAERDQEIVQLIGTDAATVELMAASIQETAATGVFSRASALKWIGLRLRSRAYNATKPIDMDARDALRDVVLSHVPCRAGGAACAAVQAAQATGAQAAQIIQPAVLQSAQLAQAAAQGRGAAAGRATNLSAASAAGELLSFRPKLVYLAAMVRRLVPFARGECEADSKDYYGMKRLELAGDLLGLLWEDAYKRLCLEIQRTAQITLSRSSRAQSFDACKAIRPGLVTDAFSQAISTGNWIIRRFRMDMSGVSQVLSRLSFMAALGMCTRLASNFDKSIKSAGPRALQPSQWGMVCPADTPEGGSCGLVKNLALMCNVSPEEDPAVVERACFVLGVEDAEHLTGAEIASNWLVFLNGDILGVHQAPNIFCEGMRALRRAGRLPEYTSVSLDPEARTVTVACDRGRVCRPLIVVQNQRPALTPAVLQDVAGGYRSFDDCVRDGVIEYIDVCEEANALVAVNESEITPETTHLEIDPVTVLGLVASLIPFPDHNQSPRNTYQCAMGKQAIGAIALNQLERFDTLLYLLCYPQRPLVKTRILELTGFLNLPAGQNATVAVMSYSGYDIEDASILNRAAIDRGYGRCQVFKKLTVGFRAGTNATGGEVVEELAGRPRDETGALIDRADRRVANYRALDYDGLPLEGAKLKPGDIVVSKQIRVSGASAGAAAVAARAAARNGANGATAAAAAEAAAAAAAPAVREAHERFKLPHPYHVDRTMVTTTPTTPVLVKVRYRQTRLPELGDKFSSRHGQKGVCGCIVQQADMPFSELGLCPDMIMNPHGFPSRMTVGKLFELVSGKAGVFDGRHGDGTVFSGDDIEACGRRLAAHGFCYHGKDLLMSGITGEPLSAFIFMGPIYYQKLKHMVLDKMHARARGPRALLTRQPTEGRSRDGGLRLGEMERDCLVAYGAASLLLERLMISSDEFEAHVCQKCGLLAAAGWCQGCRTGAHISTIRLPYACKLLLQEMSALGCVPRLRLTDQ